jgi:hypothetical protein
MCVGAVSWIMGEYAFFILKYILDTFWNVKKIETKKNSHVHVHVLRSHKIVSWKTDLSCNVCKKHKIQC